MRCTKLSTTDIKISRICMGCKDNKEDHHARYHL